MDALLKGKTAVISGSNRGIGKAILDTFARNGANVFAVVRKVTPEFKDTIASLGNETGVQITALECDFSNSEQVKETGKAILGAKVSIDVLVNNAAVIDTALFQMTSIEKAKELFEVNFFSQLSLSQYITRAMVKQQSGSIINISSSAAIENNEGRTAYAASKSALISATIVLSRELGPKNVRANAIAPGLTETEMMRGSTPDSALKETVDRTSLRRTGRPEEIANVALFLASDLSSFVTGQVLSVDGGL